MKHIMLFEDYDEHRGQDLGTALGIAADRHTNLSKAVEFLDWLVLENVEDFQKPPDFLNLGAGFSNESTKQVYQFHQILQKPS